MENADYSNSLGAVHENKVWESTGADYASPLDSEQIENLAANAPMQGLCREKLCMLNSSFWFDNWLGSSPLANDKEVASLPTLLVHECLIEGEWRLS